MIDNQNIPSDDELDVYEPGTSGEILSYLKRSFNALNDASMPIRKKAILNIYEKLAESKFAISGMVSQQIMIRFDKQLLQGFSDKSEKVREYSIKILSEMLSKCDDMQPFLPYIFSVLCERVNCQDLEGILNMPEVMRPPPGQKPKMLIKLVEDSEELRQEICKLLEIIVTCSQSNMLYSHVDDVCNILRALCMDPCGEVQRLACKCVSEFCINNKELLLHFTEILARGLLLPLISKKSKVRIAALEALGAVLLCGVWKYNANVFEILVGFRDPNSVPIKDFYEPSHNINYLATFITDPKVQVRDMFLRCVGDWVSRLPDRYDHLPRLIPYLLSGMFDDFQEIRETCFEVLEEAGQEEEREKEKELRESKQYGMDAPWSYGGKLKNLPLPSPISKRPCLGARMLVRGQYRKFQKALFSELKDSNLSSRIRAANLLRISVIYCEDYMTQFLDDAIRSLLWSVVLDKPEEQPIAKLIQECFFYIGRYCDFNTYLPIIKTSIKGEFYQNEDYVRCSFESLGQLVKGSLEAIPSGHGLGHKKQLVEEVLDILGEKSVVNAISTHNFIQAANLCESLLRGIMTQGNPEEVKSILSTRSEQLLNVLGVVSYTQLVDKAFLPSTPITHTLLQDVSAAASNNEVFKLLDDVLDFSESKLEIFVSQLAAAEENIHSINFGDVQWKTLVSTGLYHVFYEKSFQHMQEIYKIINELLANAQIPDFPDFLTKLNALFTLALLNRSKEIQGQKSKEKGTQLACQDNQEKSSQVSEPADNSSILTQLEDQWLEVCGFYTRLIESTASVSKWMQEETAKIKITPAFQAGFLNLLKFSLEGLFSEELNPVMTQVFLKADLSSITTILTSIPVLFKKFYKKNELEISKLLNNLIKRIKTIIAPRLVELKVKSDEQVKVYAIPVLITFTMERIERLGDPADMKLANVNFETLGLLLEYIPLKKDMLYVGEKHIIEDFDVLVQKLLKYALDEKDVDLKKLFLEILKKLVVKTTFNFRMEYEAAISRKQFSRVDLLKSLQPK